MSTDDSMSTFSNNSLEEKLIRGLTPHQGSMSQVQISDIARKGRLIIYDQRDEVLRCITDKIAFLIRREHSPAVTANHVSIFFHDIKVRAMAAILYDSDYFVSIVFHESPSSGKSLHRFMHFRSQDYDTAMKRLASDVDKRINSFIREREGGCDGGFL